MSKIVRISDQSYEKLGELGRRRKKSLQSILDEALERLFRQELLERANLAYAQQRSDAHSWAEELEERTEWEATVGDGLEQGDA